MAEKPAVNASPLIFLARGDLLDLLKIADDKIIIPAAVAAEVQERGAEDPTVQAMEKAAWMTVVPTPPIDERIQAWDLGPGESSVLSWGYTHQGTEIIIDDLAARRCATTLGIPFRGTLGLVLVAKRRGIIPLARPVVNQLRQLGMYLSDQVVDRALALVGE